MPLRLVRLVVAAICLVALGVLAACNGSDDPSAATIAVGTSAPGACSAAGQSAPPVTSTAARPVTPEPTARTGGVERSDLPWVEFIAADGTSACLPIEVVPPDEFTIGLSGRYELDDRGMLFYFGVPGRGSFWMKNTHVDLSIAFVGEDNRIVEIREMRAESLDYVTPSADYTYAIEAQPGWYARHGIETGAEVRFAFDLQAALKDAALN